MFDEGTFREAEHPRGQPGNPGQFASAAGGGGSKGEGSSRRERPDFRASLARETTQSTTQPVQSIDELYKRAKAEEPEFKHTINSIAERYGAGAMYTPSEHAEPGTVLKSRKSAERKLRDELGGDASKLRDVIRATVVSYTVESTRKAAAEFIAEHGDAILRVKDRYTDPLQGGYRDILINYRTPGGLVAEVQFNSKNMVKTKNGDAHKLYEIARELRNPSRETVEKLEQQMAQLYDSAYQADGDGKGWKHSMQQHDSAEVQPLRRYKLSQPDGPSFEAAIVEQDGAMVVVTNRTGDWQRDSSLSYADLIMPEQSLSDWEVTPIKTEEARDGFQRRAVDRTFDIEYYTNEALGPNREFTPEGFLICYDVPAARVGEMIYGPGEVPSELGVGQDGRIRVVRSAAEVFSPRSMASLNGKPVTDDHPPVDVDPKNWKFYFRGVVVNPRRGEGEFSDFLIVDMIIYDEELIKDIIAGKKEVSCGYNPDYLQLLDKNNEPIVGRGEQVNIIYNHLALVKAGRCGPACSVGDRRTIDSDAGNDTDNSFFTLERARRLRRLERLLT